MKILSSALSSLRVTRRRVGHGASPLAGLLHRSKLLLFAGLLCLLTLPLTIGFGGGSAGSGAGAGGFNPGSEGEGTLPSTFDAGTGLVLVGSATDIRMLVASVAGTGSIQVDLVDPEVSTSPLIVRFHGNLSVALDRDGLTSGAVDLYFGTGMVMLGGSARAMLDGDRLDPFLLNEMFYPLPLAELCASSAERSARFGLEAMSLGLDRYRLLAQARGDVVRLVQRTNF
jgi:hypothetical protein